MALRFAVTWRMLALGLLVVVAVACGPNVALEKSNIRTMIADLAEALIAKDHDRVAGHVDNFMAIGASNPEAAKDWETEEGREKIKETHYRSLKLMLNDASITDQAGVQRLLENTAIHIASSTLGTATFEIAANREKKRSAERVIWTLSKSSEGRWRVSGYTREIK